MKSIRANEKIVLTGFLFLTLLTSCQTLSFTKQILDQEVVRREWNSLFPGVRLLGVERPGLRAWIVEVNLTQKGLSVSLLGDERGASTTEFLMREGFRLAINGGPFVLEGYPDQPRYEPWSRWVPFTKNRRVGGPTKAGQGALVQHADGRWKIVDQKDLADGERQVGGGFRLLLNEGQNVVSRTEDGTPSSTKREPRTAVGLDQTGEKLFLLVADGRLLGVDGLTLDETAELLSSAGASDAVNWDGGGSSSLVMLREGRAVEINHPRGNPLWGGQRNVATVLGIRTAKESEEN